MTNCSFFFYIFFVATIFELMMAADFLGMKKLLRSAAKAVAGLMVNRTGEQICKTFNIKNDFTAAEKEEMENQTKNFPKYYKKFHN